MRYFRYFKILYLVVFWPGIISCDQAHKNEAISEEALTEASQADYEGMRMISSEYDDKRIAAPHTWHASEVFLYLYEIK